MKQTVQPTFRVRHMLRISIVPRSAIRTAQFESSLYSRSLALKNGIEPARDISFLAWIVGDMLPNTVKPLCR